MEYDLVTFYKYVDSNLLKFTYKVKRGDDIKLKKLITKHMKKKKKIYSPVDNFEILYQNNNEESSFIISDF